VRKTKSKKNKLDDSEIYELAQLCARIPQCIGWSNTRKRLYTTISVYIPGIETHPLNGHMTTRVGGLLAGVPIGGTCNNAVYMGTLSFFVKDNQGNYYAVTDSHVVPCYNTVYFPSPLLIVNSSFTQEMVPITSPWAIGQVYYRTNINNNYVNLDVALIKINTNVKVSPITYGNHSIMFFDIPHELEPVIKVGARTGITTGFAIDQSVTLKVKNIYGNVIWFEGPLFKLYSQEGDSGAPILAGESLVSTLVAGNGQFALGNDVENIESLLSSKNLKFYTSSNKNVLYTTVLPAIIGGALLTLLGLKET